MKKILKRIYLDHASTTALDPRVLRSMMPYLRSDFANPSSLYMEGVKMKKAMEGSRQKIAKVLNVHKDEIIFTGSGTEGNNLALLGLFESAKRSIIRPHIITTSIEHPSVLEVCREIEKRGGKVTYVPVGDDGTVDPREINKSLTPSTALVSVMYANNEIGTIEPLQKIAKVIRQYNKVKSQRSKVKGYPYFHTDGSQAANYLDLNVEKLGVDLMTLDASKIYGPRGSGILFCRKRLDLQPILFGGGQEKGLRAGTENISAIVGMAEALRLTQRNREEESKRLLKLRNYFIKEIVKNIPDVILNGNESSSLPNIVNICIPDLDAEFAVFVLDAKGIAISSVTSCRNLSDDPSSYVIEALGKRDCNKASLRFSFGRYTTKAEIDYCLKILYTVGNGIPL